MALCGGVNWFESAFYFPIFWQDNKMHHRIFGLNQPFRFYGKTLYITQTHSHTQTAHATLETLLLSALMLRVIVLATEQNRAEQNGA